MVLLPGGEYLMGATDSEASVTNGELPAHLTRLDPFWISRTAVSNAEFDRFAHDSRYVTQAERFGWSWVFVGQIKNRAAAASRAPGMPWWRQVYGAEWRHPCGPGSDLGDLMDHPVVHVSWHDAVAYCRWAGARLPTEAEWEFAARGGLVQQPYPWGDELTPGGVHRMNIWQGLFPTLNRGDDGYFETCPVDAYPPNDYGLFNMTGNVWEWCADWFDAPVGADESTLHPGHARVRGTYRALRGGSYLCHPVHSRGYRVSARNAVMPESSMGNLGFRCARSAG